MEDYLKKVVARCDAELADLKKRNTESQSADELRSIGVQMEKVMVERADAQSQLDKISERAVPAPIDERGMNPMDSYGLNRDKKVDTEGGELRSSMEYREAFMKYVQSTERGKAIPEILTRADAEQVTSDLGILLPNTIVQRIMKDVEQVYGQLYSKVRKTNVKGGVQYPIGEFRAEMYWDGMDGSDKEHGVTEEQSVGRVTGYITFTYHIGEIRIAQSLLQSVLSVQVFEDEIVKALVQAYVRTMDEMILVGDGVKQPEGIITEAMKLNSRIPESNIITFTTSEMKLWKTWQRKLFAQIPLSMRNLRPEFIMTAETFEANIMTMSDNDNRPVYRETYNPVTGDETATFKGRGVTFVEESEGIKSFDTAKPGEFFGIYWVPSEAYLINSNMQFGYKKYFDEDRNKWITKALVICDGKILDPKYIWLLKKAE